MQNDQSRPVATNPDEPRHVATERDDRLVELLADQNTFLKEQIKVKDRQIEVLATANEAIIARLGETNVVIQRDQSLFERVQMRLLNLLPGRASDEPHTADERGKDTHTEGHQV